MTLQSNTFSQRAELISYDEYQGTQSSSGQDSYRCVFTVSPSPCNNTGGRERHFSPYSFTRIEEFGAVGAQTFGSWGRNKSDNGISFFRWGSKGCYGFGSTWGRYLISPSTTLLQNSARNKALSKLYEQMRNSEVSLNTSIGEGRETLEMLHGIAKRFRSDKYRVLYESTSDLIRALKKDPRSTVSSAWLGWSVGWKPFLQDIQNIFNHFTSLQKQPYLDFVACPKVRASEREHKSTRSGDVYETCDYETRIEFRVKYRIVDLPLFNTWQLGLTVRPTLAWELTRLSFVIDYFVNIGQYLELLEASIASNGIQFLEGYQTVSERTDRFSTWNQPKGDIPPKPVDTTTFPPTVMLEGYNSCSMKVTTKSRSLLTSLPVPIAPTFKTPKASSQILTCMALLSNLIPRINQ